MSKTDVMRIQRLDAALRQAGGDALANAVMQGSDAITDKSNERTKVAWAKGAIERLEALADADTCVQALRSCGAQCARSHLRSARKAGEVYSQTGSLHAAVAAMQGQGAPFHLRREGETIYLTYERCFCSLVRAAREPISATYCQCSVGFTRAVWSAILGRPPQVQLLQSVIAGAPECLFAINTQSDAEESHV